MSDTVTAVDQITIAGSMCEASMRRQMQMGCLMVTAPYVCVQPPSLVRGCVSLCRLNSTQVPLACTMASVAASSSSLTLGRAVDDLHLHCRDGADVLEDVLTVMLTRPGVPAGPSPIARALLMPNLQPPVTTGPLASAYRQRVLDALQRVNQRRSAADTAARGADAASAFPLEPLRFEPLMSLYLTDATSPADIEEAKSAHSSTRAS
jgi:hypothetical protein